MITQYSEITCKWDVVRNGENDQRDQAALARYNGRYDNQAFIVATVRRSSHRANALIDTALALCGSPYYRPEAANEIKWSKTELAFLSLFRFSVVVEPDQNGVRFYVYVVDGKGGRGLYAMVNGREDAQAEYLRACEKYGVVPVLPTVDELEAAELVQAGTYVGPFDYDQAQKMLRYFQGCRHIDTNARVFGGLVLVRQGEGFNVVELRPGC